MELKIKPPDLLKLNRFTTIEHLEDLLKRKKLVLINPACWEDSNDKATIEIFKSVSKKQSIYALCLTHENETIHHWNALAPGKTGCCIEISPNKFFKNLQRIDGLSYKKVKYIRVNDLSNSKIKVEDLPFVKRDPYKNENEYRLVLIRDSIQDKLCDIAVDLSFIRRVTINDKVSQEEFEIIKARLLKAAPSLKVYRSTLYNNSKWINHFDKKFRRG